MVNTLTSDGEFAVNMSTPSLRPLVPLWVAAVVIGIEASPQLFEKAWAFIFARSFHDTLTAAREALASGNLLREGKGARYPEEPVCEDGAVQVEEGGEDDDVGLLLCEDDDEEEDASGPWEAEGTGPPVGAAGSQAEPAQSSAPVAPRQPLGQVERLAAPRLI